MLESDAEGKQLPVSYGVWIVIGYAIALILSFNVDLNNCDYDACRFLSANISTLDISPETSWTDSTLLMHLIYGNDATYISGFVRSFLINAIITSAALPLIGWRNPIFSSPLALAFFLLPGKEFYLILAIGFLAKAKIWQIRQRKLNCIAMIIIAIALTFLVRPGYILVGGLALLLGKIWIEKKFLLLWILLSIIFISSLFAADYLDRSLPDAGFDVESTIETVNVLREHTAGIFLLPTIVRFFIYAGYLFALPIAEIFRIIRELSNSGLMPYHIFLIAGILEWIKCTVFLKQNINFFAYVLISSFLIAVSYSFIHTRYLLPLMVLLIAFDPYSNNYNYHTTTES